MKKDPTVMIITIAKNDTTKAEETTAVEERKFHSVSSMGRTKTIGQMNAPSPLKEKKSLIGRIPSQQSQSIIPRSCHHSLQRWQPLGLLRQMGWCHTRSSTTIRYRMRHLRNNQYRCYHLRTIVRHGRGAPRHSLTTRQLYPHVRSSNRGRYQKEQARDPLAAGSTSSMLSPEDPMNQYMRRRSSAKNTSEPFPTSARADASEQLGRMSQYLSLRQTFGCSTTHIMTPLS